MLQIWINKWSEDGNWKISKDFLTAKRVYRSITWIWQIKFCNGFLQCWKCVHIKSLKITAEILRGVPPLLKVCTYSPSENDNWNFARSSPTDFSLPLEPKQFSGSTNNSINYFLFDVLGFPLNEGGRFYFLLLSLL